MGTVAVGMSMSLDGFVTGPHDSRKNPLGEGGEILHDWIGPKATAADRVVGAGSGVTHLRYTVKK